MIDDLVADVRRESFVLPNVRHASRPLYNHIDTRAYLAEQSVMGVLRHYGFSQVKSYPDNRGWVRDARGLQVRGADKVLHEFDEAGFLADHPVLIEVKSAKLNGFHHKISRALSFGEELFGSSADLLIFFPFRYAKKCHVDELDALDHVYCVDTAWSRKSLGDAVDRFYRQAAGR